MFNIAFIRSYFSHLFRANSVDVSMSNTFSHREEEEEMPAPGRSGSGDNGGVAGFTREAKTHVRIGTRPPERDLRKYPRMDVKRGLATSAGFTVTKVDRLSVAETAQFWERLLDVYGLRAAEDGHIIDFMDAVLFQHTINGGSVLQPDRAKFTIGGSDFDFKHAHDVMGNDLRRFYRCNADEVRAVNAKVVREYNPNDPVKKEKWDWLQEVAYKRGLQRHPDLSHDSSSACTGLDATERAAVAASSVYVIGNSLNTADTLHAGRAVLSADNVDSTAGVNVPHASAARAGRVDVVA